MLNENDKAIEQQADVETINSNLVETNVRFLGDKTAIAQIIQLLAYIRHAVKYNLHTHIDVEVGKFVMNTPLAFDVNGQEVSDLVTQPIAQIN